MALVSGGVKPRQARQHPIADTDRWNPVVLRGQLDGRRGGFCRPTERRRQRDTVIVDAGHLEGQDLRQLAGFGQFAPGAQVQVATRGHVAQHLFQGNATVTTNIEGAGDLAAPDRGLTVAHKGEDLRRRWQGAWGSGWPRH